MKICPTLASAAGLLGGYKVASTTGNRPLGGAVLGLAGWACYVPHRRLPFCLRLLPSTRQENWRVAGSLYRDWRNRSVVAHRRT